jgi:uncharacterized HAD superfamily protein
MSGRRIYVDIDDVLAETIECLLDLLEEMHDRRVVLSDVEHFDLTKSFGLDQEGIDRFMTRAHDDDIIESIVPMAGAAKVLSNWDAQGHRVTLVTGRPPTTNAASARWLETHGFRHDALHHLDKWSRPGWNRDGLPEIAFEDLTAFDFDFAVEDSLDTAVRLVEEFEIPVALMDRPWNRELDSVSKGTRASLVRCVDWTDVDREFGATQR